MKNILVITFLILSFAGVSQNLKNQNQALEKSIQHNILIYDSLYATYEKSREALNNLNARFQNDPEVSAVSSMLAKIEEFDIKKRMYEQLTKLELMVSKNNYKNFDINKFESYKNLNLSDTLKSKPTFYRKAGRTKWEENIFLKRLETNIYAEQNSMQVLIKQSEDKILINKNNIESLKNSKNELEIIINEIFPFGVELKIDSLRNHFEEAGPNGFSEDYFQLFPEITPKNSLIVYNTAIEQEVIVDRPDIEAAFVEPISEYIKKNLIYPKIDRENLMTVRITARLVISKTGIVEKVEILKDEFPEFPEFPKEVLRMVKSMPNWKPAENGGQKVRSYRFLKVRFN